MNTARILGLGPSRPNNGMIYQGEGDSAHKFFLDARPSLHPTVSNLMLYPVWRLISAYPGAPLPPRDAPYAVRPVIKGDPAHAVEHIFSGGRDTISMRRASLKPDTIRMLMMVKQRLRLARLAVMEIVGDD